MKLEEQRRYSSESLRHWDALSDDILRYSGPDTFGQLITVPPTKLSFPRSQVFIKDGCVFLLFRFGDLTKHVARKSLTCPRTIQMHFLLPATWGIMPELIQTPSCSTEQMMPFNLQGLEKSEAEKYTEVMVLFFNLLRLTHIHIHWTITVPT